MPRLIQLLLKVLVPSALLSIGFIKEFVFVNMNYRISSVYHNSNSYELPFPIDFLNSCDYSTLYYLKFFFTFLWIISYFILSLICVKIFFNKKQYIKLVFISYLIIILASLILFTTLLITTDYNTAYQPTRKIIELVESPIVIMTLFPLFFFMDSFEKHKNDEKRQ